MPRVSIGMPVYNGAQFIRDALDAILAQDFTDFELIISDNASTDATQQICESYARRDHRIRYSRLPENVGAAKNYNRVFQLSSGEFFKWAAHDDVVHRLFVRRCVDAFADFDTPPIVIYPRTEFIDEVGRVIGPDRDGMNVRSRFPAVRAFEVLQTLNHPAAVCGLFHRPTLAKTQLIGSFAASDYVLLLEGALYGQIVQLDGKPMFWRRIHPKISRIAHASSEEALRWFDPHARSRLTKRQRLYLEYLRSVARCTELGFAEKALCIASVVAGVATKRSRVALGRWRARFMSGAGGVH